MLPRLERLNPEFAAWWVAELNDAYWVSFGREDRYRHAAFVRRAFEAGETTAAGVRVTGGARRPR